MKLWKLIFPLSILVLSSPVAAILQESLSSGDQTARTFLNQIDQKKMNAGSHPFYQGTGNMNYQASELKGRGQNAAAHDSASQMVFESSDKRPQMKIDPTKDPLLTGSQKVLDNPLEIIGGAGTQVVELQQGGKTETILCEESGEDSLETCTRELTIKVEKIKVRKEWNSAFEYGKCCDKEKHGHYLPCPALRGAISLAKRALSGKGARGGSPINMDTALNITVPYKACMAESNKHICNKGGCKTVLPRTPFNTDQIKEVLLVRDPHNARKLSMQHTYFHEYGSGRTEYNYRPVIKIVYEEDSYRVLPDEWSDNCARLESRVDSGLCGYHSRTCSQARQTRIIDGVPITRDCWQETMTYACSYPAKDDCGPLRARGCAQINSSCKQRIRNACVVYQQTYQCKDSPRTTFQITGGNTPFCMDGNCRDQTWENNDELMSSVAQLSILKEMQGNFKNGFLFKGEDNRCSKYVLSFKDCCGSGKGWGKDMGLGSCKAQEKLLNTKRKAGLCHRVGTYCDKKVLGQCVMKKTSFCCFGSKLLKAFHEQGRVQIKMGWGSPERPLCRGFTIEEVQRIDFSKLDLREVFEELMKNYKPGKMGDIGRQVGQRLEIIKKGMVPNAKLPQAKQRNEG